jgi:hypothetical protein
MVECEYFMIVFQDADLSDEDLGGSGVEASREKCKVNIY